ncbi:hypothetical protein K440DRAFT_681296 [Wilcoxina mikolae CBS 423.85]|nr:hypothetical protein K440DRAFT_681296 [Wilcoxina mikolae CBS 423.85]
MLFSHDYDPSCLGCTVSTFPIPVRLPSTSNTLRLCFIDTTPLIPLTSRDITITTPLQNLTEPPPYLISKTYYITKSTYHTTYIATLPNIISLGPLRTFSLDRYTWRRHRREAFFDALLCKFEIHLGYLQQIVDQILPCEKVDYDDAVLCGDMTVSAGAMGGLWEFLVDLETEIGVLGGQVVELGELKECVETVLGMEQRERRGELSTREKWEMYFIGWLEVGRIGREVIVSAYEAAEKVDMEEMKRMDLEDFESGIEVEGEGEGEMIGGVVVAGVDWEEEFKKMILKEGPVQVADDGFTRILG